MVAIAKNAARLTLSALHYVLPRFVYVATCGFAFSVYRGWLRRSYETRIQELRKSRDFVALRRAETVYAVMPYSLVGVSGLERTYDLATITLNDARAGAFVECGVAQGGSAALLAMIAQQAKPPRTCWFFDSFEGLPQPTDKDFQAGRTGAHIRPLPKGSCLGTLEQVSDLLFRRFHLSANNIRLVKGWFQDSLPKTRQQIGPIALLRLDGDWYDSTMCCLEQLFEQVVAGGYIIIDDYFSCYGCQRAVDEFLSKRRLVCKVVPDGRGGCSFQKPIFTDSTEKAAPPEIRAA
jgi:O-methyltransferase